jgi:hypothetical protein
MIPWMLRCCRGRELAEDPVAQDLGVRDDRRERGAQVVRDVREELRLERVTGLELRDAARRLLELGLQAPPRARRRERVL